MSDEIPPLLRNSSPLPPSKPFYRKPQNYTIALGTLSLLGAAFLTTAAFVKIPGAEVLHRSSLGYALIAGSMGLTGLFGIGTYVLIKKSRESDHLQMAAAEEASNGNANGENPAAGVGSLPSPRRLPEAKKEDNKERNEDVEGINRIDRTGDNAFRYETKEYAWNPEYALQKNGTHDTKITVKDLATLNGADNLLGKTAVLNFANSIIPCGGQEGYLTSASQNDGSKGSHLNAVLLDHKSKVMNEKNRTINDPYIEEGSCLYSYDIRYKNKGKIDTISAAAPNLRDSYYSSMSVDARNELMKKTIQAVLYSAYINKVDNLVLGAFGCGAFGWDPKVVAEMFKTELTTNYKGVFKNVIFAVVSGVNKGNSNAFMETFAENK